MIDKMELGEFYRELRIARGVKQNEVACEGLTASQLSKFELGQSMLSADKLFLAIEGINMTFAEFAYKLNSYQESQHIQLGHQIVDLFVRQDKDSLEDLLNKVQEKVSSQQYIRLNKIVIQNALHSLDSSYILKEEDKQFITAYLFAIDSWTWFELYLFFNTMPLLSDQDLLFLSTALLEKSQEFQQLMQNKLYLKKGLLNVISELLERGYYRYVPLFEIELEKILTVYDIFENILLKFLREICIFLKFNGSNKKEIETFIQSIEVLDNPQLIALLTLKLQQYKKLLEAEANRAENNNIHDNSE
ncbi:Rgg family transcriptional regulator [Streptococcus constellatus subsp. pharyngis]|uniref:Predicted transcriptional regulators n=3 Tax=Streptococcus constellatus TaxID=76860 RepID=U2Y9U7_STRCV|nr:Rgg/GadR/MutR family transcriptional regulator [Streptococcus constellatus]AGU72086.1 putative transcriptional regulator [Streptococcus constellatus subsp. pharyngis C232]AGU73842.1 putative transcriptional regulator [Streptococcus constellatus subsp. pharyngis C818]AGU79210.1 putative transcriptional regulator [Streptococcus constellatus subsp. pharyngis C1050]QQC22233.1 Rgg/GadR/MutR family transcriptional regulator [Streptococcus constellatus]QRP81467.1 Rgg/GadR/MutR family transcription